MDRLRSVYGVVACAAIFSMGAVGCAPVDSTSETDESTTAGEDEIRTCASGTTVEGLDVSYYQGTVDWQKVKASGRSFAFVRVSDGTKYIDNKFDTNWKGTKAAGLLRGAYQFFRPAQSAEAQATIMINAIGQLGAGDLPAVIDVETADGQSSSTITKKIQTWVDMVEAATGKRPIIYAASGFWNTLSGTSQFVDYPLWVANYGASCPSMPKTWSNWKFWQYSDRGKVPGITTGGVDVNVWNGTLADLEAWANPVKMEPMELGWARNADGSYSLASSASDNVARVEYYVDGFAIGGATKADGPDFPDQYSFSVEKARRLFEVKGFDANEQQVAKGIGLIDVTPGTGVFIRQTGASEYEIGIEREPAGIGSIEVTADGYLLTDSVTGQSRSTRLAVDYTFNTLGERSFTIDIFRTDGTKRATLYRTFQLE